MRCVAPSRQSCYAVRACALVNAVRFCLFSTFNLAQIIVTSPWPAGTIGHVAHGKSTVVKAISGVQTVRFKNELERNITIKLGYANAKIYKCGNVGCERPASYRAYGSAKEVRVLRGQS